MDAQRGKASERANMLWGDHKFILKQRSVLSICNTRLRNVSSLLSIKLQGLYKVSLETAATRQNWNGHLDTWVTQNVCLLESFLAFKLKISE